MSIRANVINHNTTKGFTLSESGALTMTQGQPSVSILKLGLKTPLQAKEREEKIKPT